MIFYFYRKGNMSNKLVSKKETFEYMDGMTCDALSKFIDETGRGIHKKLRKEEGDIVEFHVTGACPLN